jgi:hypothetical protein
MILDHQVTTIDANTSRRHAAILALHHRNRTNLVIEELPAVDKPTLVVLSPGMISAPEQ